jgi:hypothetical protein
MLVKYTARKIKIINLYNILLAESEKRAPLVREAQMGE